MHWDTPGSLSHLGTIAGSVRTGLGAWLCSSLGSSGFSWLLGASLDSVYRARESSGGSELEDGAGDLGIQLRKRGGGITGRREIKKEGGEKEIKGEDIRHLESNRKEEGRKRKRLNEISSDPLLPKKVLLCWRMHLGVRVCVFEG